MRWLLRILGVLLVLLVVSVAAIWLLSRRAMGARYDVSPEAVTIPTDSAALARGQHLGTAIGKCVDCHGMDLSGQAMALGPVGTFTARNLTSGKGGLGSRTDADWVRSIRHGVAPDGRPLVFMPSRVYAALSNADLGALIAWVKSMPPVDHELPASTVGPIGRVILATSPERLISARLVDHAAPIPAAVPPGPTPEYGRYLAVSGGCTFCHGDNLKGGLKDGPPDTPLSADLTQAGPLGQWTEADFTKALREGVRPDGSNINPFMPWRLARLMTDEEISAVWAYLKTVRG